MKTCSSADRRLSSSAATRLSVRHFSTLLRPGFPYRIVPGDGVLGNSPPQDCCRRQRPPGSIVYKLMSASKREIFLTGLPVQARNAWSALECLEDSLTNLVA